VEGRYKSVARDSDQNGVSNFESLREQMSVAGVQDVEGSSESHKFVAADRSGQVAPFGPWILRIKLGPP